MGIKLSSVATVTAHNTNYNGQMRLEKADTSALFNQVISAVLHVLLNNSTLLNSVQSYHPCSHEYTDMKTYAMHCFQ